METELLAQSVPKTMTYEEYLAWANEDTHTEWVNGEVFIASASGADAV